MANYRIISTCNICKQEKECTSIGFIPDKGEDRVKPKPYAGTVGTVFPGEFFMRCCEDCGRERGKVSKGPWIAILSGYAIIAAGAGICASVEPSSNINGLGIFVVFLGWLTSMIAGCILVTKNHQESGAGGIFLSLFAQFFPIFGLLTLVVKAKKINRCARAVSALRPVAEEKRRSERETDETLARRAESGIALTEAEQAQLEARTQEKEEAERRERYAREEQERKTNSFNMRHAVFSILFTVAIGLYGASVYSSGRGYMQLFRTIDLSPGGFAAVIGVLIVWDVIALVSALKKRR